MKTVIDELKEKGLKGYIRARTKEREEELGFLIHKLIHLIHSLIYSFSSSLSSFIFVFGI